MELKQEINWEELRKKVEEDRIRSFHTPIKEEELIENEKELEEVGKELEQEPQLILNIIKKDEFEEVTEPESKIITKTPKYKVWRIIKGFLVFFGVLFLIQLSIAIFILIKFPNLITFS